MKIIRSLSFTVAQVVVNKVITNRRKEKRKTPLCDAVRDRLDCNLSRCVNPLTYNSLHAQRSLIFC
ncbi:hypothetical protein HMPREF0666_02506 [Prevotella sp. C561]|nr:hypothetical protein HMPREF0666_02506 [Prevotella sp. C561]